jgi:hypothetical protein
VPRLFAICLIVAFGALPAIDAVYCPDGCTDANQPRCVWQTDASCVNGACGLCINGVAVHAAFASVDAVQRLTATRTVVTFGLISIPPRAVDRPPRRS